MTEGFTHFSHDDFCAVGFSGECTCNAMERIETEYWQMREALGYPIPSAVDAKLIGMLAGNGGKNPFECGKCGSRRLYPHLRHDDPTEIERLREAVSYAHSQGFEWPSDPMPDMGSTTGRDPIEKEDDGWRTIESAPKIEGARVWDQPRIQLWAADRPYHGRWNPDDTATRPRPFWEMDALSVAASRACQPTHWRPLPAPPNSTNTITDPIAKEDHTEMNFKAHLVRQIRFSRDTFGPGERSAGVSEHIAKELAEVKNGYAPEYRAAEWVDVVILGLDGFWRALATAYPCLSDEELAARVCQMIEAKQSTNEGRAWPDWRTYSSDQAIEHIRANATNTVTDPIADAVAKENEACARIAEDWGKREDRVTPDAFIPGADHGERFASEGIAATIRARIATPEQKDGE